MGMHKDLPNTAPVVQRVKTPINKWVMEIEEIYWVKWGWVELVETWEHEEMGWGVEGRTDGKSNERDILMGEAFWG